MGEGRGSGSRGSWRQDPQAGWELALPWASAVHEPLKRGTAGVWPQTPFSFCHLLAV